MTAMLTPLVGLVILVGLIGIVVPVLPGLLLAWCAAALFGVLCATAGDSRGWVLAAVVSLAYGVGLLVQYLVPGRALKERGIPWTTTAAGVVLGVVGMFVVPIVGAVVGFVLGIFLVELLRLRTISAAWPSTVHALRAVGLSMLVELCAGLVIAGSWLVAVRLGLHP